MDQAPLSSSHLEWETHKKHNRVCGTQGPRLRWVSIHFEKQVNSSIAFQYRWKEQWCAGHQGMRQKSQESERAGLLCQGDTHLIVWSQIPGVWNKWLRRWWWRWEVKNAQGEGRTRELIYRNGPDSEWYKRQKWNYSPPLLSAYADTF